MVVLARKLAGKLIVLRNRDQRCFHVTWTQNLIRLGVFSRWGIRNERVSLSRRHLDAIHPI